MKLSADHCSSSADVTRGPLLRAICAVEHAVGHAVAAEQERPVASPAASQPPLNMNMQSQMQPQLVASLLRPTQTEMATLDIRSIQAAPLKPAATSQTQFIVYQSRRRFRSAPAFYRETRHGLEQASENTRRSGGEKPHDTLASSPSNSLEPRNSQTATIAQTMEASLGFGVHPSLP